MTEKKIVGNETMFAGIEQIIVEGGGVEIRVKGQSMRPFLRNERDTVRLAPVSGGDLERGMVVLFRYRGRHILHRISRIEGDTLILQGDGNCRQSEHALRSDVSAYAESIRRGNKTIRYPSPRWTALTLWSLGIKTVRTLRRDVCQQLRRDRTR